jgi:hypothetical protein
MIKFFVEYENASKTQLNKTLQEYYSGLSDFSNFSGGTKILGLLL